MRKKKRERERVRESEREKERGRDRERGDQAWPRHTSVLKQSNKTQIHYQLAKPKKKDPKMKKQ